MGRVKISDIAQELSDAGASKNDCWTLNAENEGHACANFRAACPPKPPAQLWAYRKPFPRPDLARPTAWSWAVNIITVSSQWLVYLSYWYQIQPFYPEICGFGS